MTLDLSDYESGKKSKGNYEEDLCALQERLSRILVAHVGHGKSSLIVCEGWDAAGKGGAIQRITGQWDPRAFRVWPIRAPTAEEKARHFLWRFWNKLPGAGQIAIFDRSWYGRVLVERVEGFASEAEWERAYDEIVAFERGLCLEGTVLIKFWLHLSDEEQLRRFRRREHKPLKSWKLTEEDWRNRERRPEYEAAITAMFDRTDQDCARWTVVPADSKRYARVAVVEAVIAAIERGL